MKDDLRDRLTALRAKTPPLQARRDEPADEDGTTVRTMGNLVGDTGFEPVTSSV